VLAMITALLLSVAPAAAWAEDPPPNPTDEQIEQARSTREAQAAEVGRLTALVTGAEGEIARLQIDVENASSAALGAEAELEAARQTALSTAADVEDAAVAVDVATDDLALFARNSYIQGSTLDNSIILLDSNGPAELVERAGLLDALSSSRLDVVSQMELAKVGKANADSAQRQAVLDSEAAERAAAEALQVAESTLLTSQDRLGVLQSEKAGYEQQLQQAQEALLGVEGARRAYEDYEARKAAEEAALQRERDEAARKAAAEEQARRDNPPPASAPAPAPAPPSDDGGGGDGDGDGDGGSSPPPSSQSGDWVKPAIGETTSCFGSRWGSFHYGLDIGAPMYDPIYAAGDGTVVRAGEASGFGLAIYIEHDNGDVTVYGHEEVIKVSEGQRVYAGQVIALVGMRGFSTGPHLHFEVQLGLYGTKIDPVPWLADRGVYISGCG